MNRASASWPIAHRTMENPTPEVESPPLTEEGTNSEESEDEFVYEEVDVFRWGRKMGWFEWRATMSDNLLASARK